MDIQLKRGLLDVCIGCHQRLRFLWLQDHKGYEAVYCTFRVDLKVITKATDILTKKLAFVIKTALQRGKYNA